MTATEINAEVSTLLSRWMVACKVTGGYLTEREGAKGESHGSVSHGTSNSSAVVAGS